MLRLDSDSFDAFTATYRDVLERRGFTMRALPEPPNLGVDRARRQRYEADEAQGGHVVYRDLARGLAEPLRAAHLLVAAEAPRMPG